MQHWWFGALTAMVAAVSYIAKRWIERRDRSEGLSRRLKALTLLREMKREGVSMGDLERIERDASE